MSVILLATVPLEPNFGAFFGGFEAAVYPGMVLVAAAGIVVAVVSLLKKAST